MQPNVLFLIPPLRSIVDDNTVRRDRPDGYRTRYPHIGIAYIMAVLKKADVPCQIIDMNLGYTIDDVLEQMGPDQPPYVCMTVFSAGYKKAYAVVKGLRPHYNGSIVLGGPHISVVAGRALEQAPADYAFMGEGEFGLLELVQGADPNGIAGLIWRDRSTIVVNERRPYIMKLDQLPFPVFEEFKLDKYLCSTDKRLPLITSRGCPYLCNYCCTRLCMGKGFRVRSAENVVNEIEYWHKKGWLVIDINDDVFSLHKERAKKICRLILDRKVDVTLNLYVGLRVDNIDEALLELLAAAGCKFISYGCEAGNDHMLKRIKKGIETKDVENAVRMTRKAGINCKVNFIIGHPDELYRDAIDSIKFARKLIEIGCNFVGFNNMIPYPGTEAYSWIEENPNARFLYPPEVYLNDLTHKRRLPVFETDEFPLKERSKALVKGFRLQEKTLSNFRFGRFKGYVAYLLGLNKYLSAVSQWLFGIVLSTKVGYAAYRKLVKSPW